MPLENSYQPESGKEVFSILDIWRYNIIGKFRRLKGFWGKNNSYNSHNENITWNDIFSKTLEEKSVNILKTKEAWAMNKMSLLQTNHVWQN